MEQNKCESGTIPAPPHVTFKLRTNTSMFLHSDTKTACLHAASFRGLTRYWFRALAGPMMKPEELRELEGAVFGNTEGRGIRLSVTSEKLRTGSSSILPHKSQNPSNCITPNSEFNLTLSSIQHHSKTKDYLRAAAWSFWTAATLGGFGQRSRRGAGSVSILEVTGNISNLPLNSGKSDDAKNIAQAIEGGLKTAKKHIYAIIDRASPSPSSSPPPFPMLLNGNSSSCNVIELKESKDEKKARTEIMLNLRDFKDPAFGLPLMLRGRRIPGRHASPLWVRLLPSQHGFLGILTVMKSKTMERNSNPKKIDEFVSSWKGISVDLG